MNIEIIDQEKPDTQLDILITFEKALMYINIIDFDKLEIKEKVMYLLKRIAEDAEGVCGVIED